MEVSQTLEVKRTGLALSGGGARGIAHIGIIQALHEQGISPQLIAGTSAGSLIGAWYAAGKSPAEMLQFVKESSFWRLLRPGFSLDGLVNPDYIRQRMKETLGLDTFEALDKPLWVNVSNLESGQLESINTGPLLDVLVASCTVPLVFKPCEINKCLYVDGGILENLPTSALRSRVDYLIGANVMPLINAENKGLHSALGIATRSFELSLAANTQPSIQQCDLLIAPEKLARFGIFQFNQIDQLYEIGYEAAVETLQNSQQSLL
jgi:NTE family protein